MAIVYDPQIRTINADPFPVFRRLQDEAPVHWCEPLKSWLITRYADVRAVTLDRALSANRLKPFFAHLPGEEQNRLVALRRYLAEWTVFHDPPDHTRLRGLMNTAFTSAAVARLRPTVLAIVTELLDRAAARGEMDVIADFAYPLPASVIMDMLGVPRGDLSAVKVWSDEIALFIGSARASPDKYRRAEQGAQAMADYFRQAVAARRKQPRDDMMTALLAAQDRDERLNDDEVIATCILFLFAGHETTTNLIGNGLLSLLKFPGELARLRAEPGLIGDAVEECLRYDGPSGALARIVAEPHEIAGVRLERGDRVYAQLNAANRDPRRFAEPDRFDIARPDNRHLTFGHGIHFCVGAPLARLEGEIALGEIVRRFDRIELTVEPSSLDWLDSLILRGVKSLPVRFAARQ